MAVGQKKIISSTTFNAKIVSNCIKHSKYDITTHLPMPSHVVPSPLSPVAPPQTSVSPTWLFPCLPSRDLSVTLPDEPMTNHNLTYNTIIIPDKAGGG